jgi:hypothetical protein
MLLSTRIVISSRSTGFSDAGMSGIVALLFSRKQAFGACEIVLAD